MMKIKWEVWPSASIEDTSWWPAEYNPRDFVKTYTGKVIATTRGVFGSTYFTVICDDGEIRECPTKKAILLTPTTDDN